MPNPVHIHPENPRCFEFRGKPLILICATEHYGAVLNRPFDFESYLVDHAEKGHTLTRLFLLFRELQTPINPHSTCKPESPDYIAPWPRTGPGRALDGQPRYDLSLWNDEFFQRLHAFCALAGELGIIVEVTLFGNFYLDSLWALCPLRAENNLQQIGAPSFAHFFAPHELLWQQQSGFVRKVVSELNRYDNIYFEVCNEPGTDEHQTVSAADIDRWQSRVAEIIRETEATLPNRHLIFGGQASTLTPFPEGGAPGYVPCMYPPESLMYHQETRDAFEGTVFDAVNVHAMNNVGLAGCEYHLGGFMSGQLCLWEFKDFNLAAGACGKPCVQDEDNIASAMCNETGWTIHRKRAWVAVICGAHYDVIDFSIGVHTPTGTPASRAAIRSWLGYLSRFIHRFDLTRARPLGGWLLEKPAGLLECTLAVPGEEYAVYLADPRESEDSDFGSPFSSEVRFELPPGEYSAALFSPVTGQSSPAIAIKGGSPATFRLKPFRHDIVLHIKRNR